jgi:hypothetical protein
LPHLQEDLSVSAVHVKIFTLVLSYADTDRDTVYHTVRNDALGRNDDGKPYS